MSRRLHIQHVVLSLQPGGLENGVVNVVNRLDPLRFASSLCCLKLGGEFVARLKPGTPVSEMGWRGGNDVWLPFRMASLFRATGTDIVHTRNAESFFYGFLAAKLAGISTIVHSEHGRTFDDRPLRFRIQRLFSRQTQAIFAVSAQLRTDLVRHIGIPESRIQVLHNGVDLARFDPAARDAVRTELGIAPGTPLIGSVGRLVPVKNYPLLIEAVAALGRPDVRLLFVGDGPERQALGELAAARGIAAQTTFLGHREDVSRLLPAMDIFTLPSLSEGMSNTLLEAMACGVAAVASAVGGSPEIVNDGTNGRLFASGDGAALADILRELLSRPDLRAALAAAGRQRVLAEFTMDAMIGRYEALYQAAALR